MAIRFITGMGMGPTRMGGPASSTADPIRVVIVHNPKDGYPLSYDGDTITEEMSLRDFLLRLLHKMAISEHDLLRREDEILTAIRTNHNSRINHITTTLDNRYASLIRNGSLVLAAHNHSMNTNFKFRLGSKGEHIATTETISNSERSVTQTIQGKMDDPAWLTQNKDWDHKKVMEYMEHSGISVIDSYSEKNKIPAFLHGCNKPVDDDIYYLLTMPS